jgi:hypothetical protein
MVTARIATSAEQPINSHAALAGEPFSEGDLVGINSAGKLVKADADSASTVMAIGVALAPATQLSDYTEEAVKLVVEANRALVDRDRITAVKYGIEVENGDDDWNFTPGEPVYLAPGGGYTQTAPSTTGDLIQIVGEALTAERISLHVIPSATTA